MTTHAMNLQPRGISMKKMMLRLLVVAFVGATMFYGKTLGLLAKGFMKALKAQPPKHA